jgi:hypothetical protein
MATTRNLHKHLFPLNGYGTEVVKKKPYIKAKYKTCYDITARKIITNSVSIAINLVKPIWYPVALAGNGTTEQILDR